MQYHETGDERRRDVVGHGGDGKAERAVGEFLERDADSLSDRIGMNDLKDDYRELKKEAKSEYRQIKECVARTFEETMESAKREYMEGATALRERFLQAREQAREAYREALETAKNEYELTVDIAKDQYRTLRKETTKMFKKGKRETETVVRPEPARESAPTRVIMRLDEEIRKVSEKKAEAERAHRKDTAALAGRLEIGM